MNTINVIIELGPESMAKLDKILAALQATTPDRPKPSRPKQKGKGDKLTDQELADLFSYCARLSSMVSPRDAMKYYHFTFDGAVTDTFYGLAMLYAGEGAARSADDFKRDELYGPTLRQMLEDIRGILDGRVLLY